MANVRSTLFQSMLAIPATKIDPNLGHGRLRAKVGTVTLDNTEAAGVLLPLARFKAQDRIREVYLQHPALGAGATDNNVGVYTAVDWTAGDGVAKNVDQFCDGISFAAARATMTPLLGTGTNARTAAEAANALWQDAGDSTQPRPGTEYDVVIQAVTDPGAAGAIAFCLVYTSGD